MTFLLANWRLFAIGIVLSVVFGLGYKVGADVGEWRCTQKLDTLAAAMQARCESDKEITRKANDGLQKQNDIISGRLAALKRVQSSCIMPTSHAANATGGESGVNAGAHGLSAQFLLEFAAECEQYKQQRLALEQFQSEVWKANHMN